MFFHEILSIYIIIIVLILLNKSSFILSNIDLWRFGTH